MANNASTKKRIRQTVVRRLRNISSLSAMRTAIKRFKQAVENQDKTLASTTLRKAQVSIDKLVSKNILHANTAARKVSRLNKLFVRHFIQK